MRRRGEDMGTLALLKLKHKDIGALFAFCLLGFLAACLIPDPTATSTAARIAINRAFEGFQETGFIVIYGHGLSPETIARQFDLGNMYLSVNEEIKHHFHANISEGSWAGYKVSSSPLYYFEFQKMIGEIATGLS